MEALSLQQLLKDQLDKVLSLNNFPQYQIKALSRLSVCRTAALGGHTQYCENGHLNGVWYNSCKHRACPQCRGLASEQWLRNTQSFLLNCPHHHIIFTLPHELHPLWQYNRSLMAQLLFTAVQQTLKQFSKDPRYLDATPGMLSVLHTWGRNLSLHPHIHTLVSHGGLNHEGEWVQPRKKHLFPQKPLMMVFRGKLLAMIRQSLAEQRLELPATVDAVTTTRLINRLGRQEWVVHCCERYEHATGVAKYLARYVKGGPFKNQQLKGWDGAMLSFSYRSHQTGRRERLRLPIEQFALRLAQHVPIPGKPMVRYCGLYGSGARKRLNQARTQLGQEEVSEREVIKWQEYLSDKGFAPSCDVCGASLIHQEEVSRKKS